MRDASSCMPTTEYERSRVRSKGEVEYEMGDFDSLVPVLRRLSLGVANLSYASFEFANQAYRLLSQQR